MKPQAADRFSKKLALAGLLAFTSVLAVSLVPGVAAQPAATPSSGGTRVADQIAWESFIRAVTPARGHQGKVAYETWASDQDIYVANPCPPGPPAAGCNIPTWPTVKATKELTSTTIGHDQARRAAAAAGRPVIDAIGPQQGCGAPPNGMVPGGAAANSGFPPIPPNGPTACVGEEVRRDPASYLYIVQNNLWSKAGLQAFFSTPQPVNFPQNAVNVKADWIPVATLATWLNRPEAFVTANFYTAPGVLSPGQQPVLMAMTSMHVAVKHWGVPSNWIWANFENAYTPGRCDETGCTDRFGATTPFVVPSTAWSQYGQCAKTPAVTTRLRRAGVAAVFNNYCLTGTQEAYGTNSNPTLLGSPIIEPLNANVPMASSSCISCHTGAAFNAAGASNSVNGATGPTSVPAGFKGYDFMWGVFAAQ